MYCMCLLLVRRCAQSGKKRRRGHDSNTHTLDPLTFCASVRFVSVCLGERKRGDACVLKPPPSLICSPPPPPLCGFALGGSLRRRGLFCVHGFPPLAAQLLLTGGGGGRSLACTAFSFVRRKGFFASFVFLSG